MAKSIAEQIAALVTRIAADNAKLAELKATQKAADAMQTLAAGDIVGFMYGRGETRKQYVGVVCGVQDSDAGKQIKASVGEGFEAQYFVFQPNAIVFVGEEVQEAGAPATNVAAVDPLAIID